MDWVHGSALEKSSVAKSTGEKWAAVHGGDVSETARMHARGSTEKSGTSVAGCMEGATCYERKQHRFRYSQSSRDQSGADGRVLRAGENAHVRYLERESPWYAAGFLDLGSVAHSTLRAAAYERAGRAPQRSTWSKNESDFPRT